jgi:putative transposase
MRQSSDFRRGRSCGFALHVHLVFVANHRRHVFDGAAIEELRGIFTKVCVDFDAELRACDGEDDHVRLLIEYPPKVAISALVNSLKGHWR